MASILIVDDVLDFGEGLSDLLRAEGHDVRIACDGEEGLRLLRAAPLPDVIVLDVEMPVLDGPGMASQMLHDAGEEKIPIVLVSARDDLPQIAGRMRTPYFLRKPFAVDAVLNLLDRALRERLAPSSA